MEIFVDRRSVKPLLCVSTPDETPFLKGPPIPYNETSKCSLLHLSARDLCSVAIAGLTSVSKRHNDQDRSRRDRSTPHLSLPYCSDFTNKSVEKSLLFRRSVYTYEGCPSFHLLNELAHDVKICDKQSVCMELERYRYHVCISVHFTG